MRGLKRSNRLLRRISKLLGHFVGARFQRVARMRQSGNALLVVISAVALVAAIATAYMAIVSSQTKLLAAQTQRIRAKTAADGAARLAIWRLKYGRGSNEPLQFEIWCALDGLLVRVVATDESDRLNINLASQSELSREIERAGVSQSLADEIAAEIKDYSGQGDSAGPPHKGKQFELIDELRQMPSMTPRIYDAIEPRLSLHSRRSQSSTSSNADDDSLSPAGAIVRIESAAFDDGAVIFRRLAVVEIDQNLPNQAATRVWRDLSRGLSVSMSGLPSVDRAPACREILAGV